MTDALTAMTRALWDVEHTSRPDENPDAMSEQRIRAGHVVDWLEIHGFRLVPIKGENPVHNAAAALLTKLDAFLPHHADMVVFASVHHLDYAGPSFRDEMEALREALG